MNTINSAINFVAPYAQEAVGAAGRQIMPLTDPIVDIRYLRAIPHILGLAVITPTVQFTVPETPAWFHWTAPLIAAEAIISMISGNSMSNAVWVAAGVQLLILTNRHLLKKGAAVASGLVFSYLLGSNIIPTIVENGRQDPLKIAGLLWSLGLSTHAYTQKAIPPVANYLLLGLGPPLSFFFTHLQPYHFNWDLLFIPCSAACSVFIGSRIGNTAVNMDRSSQELRVQVNIIKKCALQIFVPLIFLNKLMSITQNKMGFWIDISLLLGSCYIRTVASLKKIIEEGKMGHGAAQPNPELANETITQLRAQLRQLSEDKATLAWENAQLRIRDAALLTENSNLSAQTQMRTLGNTVSSWFDEDPILSKFQCLISSSPCVAPVLDPDLNSLYEEDQILHYLKSKKVSPTNRQPLSADGLLPLPKLNALIASRLRHLKCQTEKAQMTLHDRQAIREAYEECQKFCPALAPLFEGLVTTKDRDPRTIDALDLHTREQKPAGRHSHEYLDLAGTLN